MDKRKFIEFFTDVDGQLSFKRLQALVALVLFVMVIVSNLYWGFILSGALTELLVFILVYTYTGITIEKFTKRGLTSVDANDQAMLMETQVNVEQRRIENALDVVHDVEGKPEEEQAVEDIKNTPIKPE